MTFVPRATSRSMVFRPSEADQKILRALATLENQYRWLPSHQELAAEAGIPVPTVHDRAHKLKNAGFVNSLHKITRTTHLTTKGKDYLEGRR